jgi:hypothetical protein
MAFHTHKLAKQGEKIAHHREREKEGKGGKKL